MSTSITSSNSTTWVPPANGIVGGYTGDDVNINRAMIAFASIAWYSALETIFLTFFRFKHYRGLYFWSMLVTAFAIVIYMIGAWGKMANIASQTLITQTFCNIGWICMVGGNSLVLWSRLHIVMQRERLLKIILSVILANCLLLYIPTTALDYGCNVNPWNRGYCDGYSIMERTQMTVFTLQEFVISGLYLWEVSRYLKTQYVVGRTKKVMWELVAVNIALIILDVALLSVEYEDLYQIEVTLKGFVYALKLKLELGVLSRLVEVVGGGTSDSVRRHTIALSSCSDKDDVEHQHLEHARSRPSESSVPWLVSFQHRSDSRPSKERSPSSLQFVTTAQIGQSLTKVDSRNSPTKSEAEEGADVVRDFGVRHGPVAAPAAAVSPAREISVSRQSSLSGIYPGRLTGG